MTAGRPPTAVLRPYLVRRWRALAGAGGATAALTAADLAKPWPLAIVVDRLLARTAPFDLSASDWRLLAAMGLLVLGIAVAEAGARYLSDLWLQSAGERIAHELRVAVYDHLQALSLGYHQRRQKGDLLTRMTGDVNAIGDLFASSLGAITQAALLAVGMTVVLVVIDPVLALVGLATAPVIAALSFVFRRRVRTQARVRRKHEGRIASIAGEALSAMAVVKAHGSERFESDRVRAGSERRMEVGVEVARLQAQFDGIVGAVRAVGTALVLVVGVMRVAAGAIGPGELIVFVSYTRKAHAPLRSLARESAKVAAALARAERVADVLAADDVLEERPGAYRGGRATGDVALERVSFSYTPERPALRDVSLRIPAGTCVALVGPSGAGKSTLAALVARLADPSEGRVVLDGRDARDCSPAWLRSQVAILLQDTVLFTGTVRENIAYATDATAEEVEAATRAAAAHEFIAALPDGYDTALGPQGVGLSGGQRQRIGIARALLRDPPILLLDEPTAALDGASEAQVLEGLRTLIAGRTTILVTHSPRLAAMADRTVRLEDGRLAAGAGERARVADGRLIRRGSPPAPEPLLDPSAVHGSLARTLHDGELTGLVVSRVVLKPDELLAVHYRAEVGGVAHDAVATRVAGADLAASARKPRYRELLRKVDGRSPGRAPLTYDGDLDALISWLPFDPRLPALAEPETELRRRLGTDGEPVLLGYKPRGRAVLRLGPLVLKAYGRRRQFDAAVAGLRAAGHGPVPTAPFAAALPELRLTAQSRLAGSRAAEAAAVAGAAGALVAALQRGARDGLVPGGPERLLDAAARKADVIAAVLPELAPRLDALVRRLAATMPGADALAPAHGDFHVDQLLIRWDDEPSTGAAGGRADPHMAVIDFDGMCLAAPALDLATYAADVVRGRERDLERVEAVLEPLLEGYGKRPAGLEWHVAAAILGRAAHPFQRQVAAWPERTEAMVRAAEASLD
jgi:ATP-binding cassette subfamily B protein